MILSLNLSLQSYYILAMLASFYDHVRDLKWLMIVSFQEKFDRRKFCLLIKKINLDKHLTLIKLRWAVNMSSKDLYRRKSIYTDFPWKDSETL